MDLQAKINEKFAELINDGYVDKVVKDALQNTVKDIISSSVKSYSTFGKELEKHIQEGMTVNLKRLSLDHYNNIVLRIVQEELDGTVLESAREGIKERVQAMLGTLEKKDWKLSEIVEKFKKDATQYSEKEGELGLHVEESKYGGWRIYLDEDATKDGGLYSSSRKPKAHYEYKYRLYLDKVGEVLSFAIDNAKPDYTKNTDSGFDAFFFKLFANKAIITVDEDDCELSCEEDYD